MEAVIELGPKTMFLLADRYFMGRRYAEHYGLRPGDYTIALEDRHLRGHRNYSYAYVGSFDSDFMVNGMRREAELWGRGVTPTEIREAVRLKYDEH